MAKQFAVIAIYFPCFYEVKSELCNITFMRMGWNLIGY